MTPPRRLPRLRRPRPVEVRVDVPREVHPPASADEVRALYRWLLGREARDDEVAERTDGELPTALLLRELLGSDEHAAFAAAREDPPEFRVNVWAPGLERWHHHPGTMSPDGVAICGRDGFFFIVEGSNSVLDHHSGRGELPAGWINDWRELVECRRDDAEHAGVRLSQLVVPDKLAVYEDRFPDPIGRGGPRPVCRLLGAGIPLRYPLEELRAARASGDTFLRTDSHLSLRGNVILHDVVCRDLGIEPPPDPLAHVVLEPHVAPGDLGERFHPQSVEVMQKAIRSPAQLIAGNREETKAAGSHIGTACSWHNPGAPRPERVVVFGDSYAYGEDGYQGLAWLLAQSFAHVYFAWVPFGWDAAIVREVEADFVVCQIAERFLVRVPRAAVSVEAITEDAEDAATLGVDPSAVFGA